MAIQTLDQYIASNKQRIPLLKTASRTTVASIPFSVLDLAGNPGAGALVGSLNPATLVTDATAGFPAINFSTGTGYLSKVEFSSTVASRLQLFDLIYKNSLQTGGAGYTAATVTFSSQAAISGRCPDYPGSGTVFGKGMEIWLEVGTAYAGGTSLSFSVNYTNSDGTAGRTTGTVNLALAALTLGKMVQLSLQAGDVGVQKIESITISAVTGTFTAGTMNVLIMRPLWTIGRVIVANSGDIHDMLKTGLPVVYQDSALYLVVQADGTASGLPELVLEIASA